MASTIRDKTALYFLDKICEEYKFISRDHAILHLLSFEYPEDTRLRDILDYKNEKLCNQEAHSIHLLSNSRKRIIKMMINGADFNTIYEHYLTCLKFKNLPYNPKGWKQFEKIKKKGLKMVYDYVQQRKAKSFSEFDSIIKESRKINKDEKLFLIGKYDIQELENMENGFNRKNKKKN